MEFRRTPDECFENLAGYPFLPNYVEVSDFEGGTLRMNYVDEGPQEAQPVVMIHGNPTWSYMWRKLIPVLAEAGYRAIAIDMIGMGRSDKPTKMSDYTIDRHEKWVAEALFEKLHLTHAHFILHDWGGMIGLRAIADHQDRVSSIIMSNTGIPVLDPSAPIEKMARPGAGMLRAFQLYVRYKKNWQHWKMLSKIVKSNMPAQDVAGFAAPYPDKTYLTGNRQFTQMLPTRNDNPILIENWHALEKLKAFEKPFLNLFSDKDQIAPKGHKTVRPAIPGAQAIEPIILKGGSHFLLEDIPEAYSHEVIRFLTSQDGKTL
ncbi:haloalkane dehalogenase [Pyruvatibacter sp. HU-CL02332]|uniref:haloalkane dehalogenase n=1 Tax=Pyruvatibacter sp. HU-CL02332 TaxID=3127650 RepID=UPI002968D5D3|nr:haloalkane dehalogenase [Alphaproteobacteria bacterium]